MLFVAIYSALALKAIEALRLVRLWPWGCVGIFVLIISLAMSNHYSYH